MPPATASRERTLGRAILGHPLLTEALEAFAEDEHRTVPNSARFLLLRVLTEWGWLAYVPGSGYIAGPHLEEHRRESAPDPEELAIVIPLQRPARVGVRS